MELKRIKKEIILLKTFSRRKNSWIGHINTGKGILKTLLGGDKKEGKKQTQDHR